jgi:hypothetical protein
VQVEHSSRTGLHPGEPPNQEVRVQYRPQDVSLNLLAICSPSVVCSALGQLWSNSRTCFAAIASLDQTTRDDPARSIAGRPHFSGNEWGHETSPAAISWRKTEGVSTSFVLEANPER